MGRIFGARCFCAPFVGAQSFGAKADGARAGGARLLADWASVTLGDRPPSAGMPARAIPHSREAHPGAVLRGLCRLEPLLFGLIGLGLLAAPCSYGQPLNKSSGGLGAAPRPNASPGSPSIQPQQTSEQQLKEFIKSFEANVYKGCMQNPSKDLRNPSGYCKCYVQAFLKRYTPEQLVRINQAAGINSVAPQLIALMMKPEVEVCKAINR